MNTPAPTAAGRNDGAARAVTDAQLELLMDGALASDVAAAVERIVASSPVDAARLAELRAADDLMRGVLVAPPPASVSRPGLRLGAYGAVAAAMLLVGAAAVVWFGRAGGGAGVPEGPAQSPTVATGSDPRVDAAYEPVRVVFSIPAHGRDRAKAREEKKVASTPAPAVPTVSPAASAMASAFNDASDGGIRRAVTAINEASPEDRAAALTALGQTLRSGSTAVRILDRLGPREQIAVCSELALDTGLRSVALLRLRELTEDPIVGPDARAAARALASAPGMKAWLRSYGLLEMNPSEPASGAPAAG